MPGQGPTEKSSRRTSEYAENLGRKSATECGGTLKKKYDKRAAWRKRNPWARYCEWARRRCNDSDPESKNYPHYYAKGITCDLTARELKAVWERDNAHLLKKPSLDRIDPERGYTMFNVRFIEFALNVRMSWDKTAAVTVPAPEFT